MSLPPSDSPLYNYPLPEIENWLVSHGCEPKENDRHCWLIARTTWNAEICLDVDSISVRYIAAREGNDVQRTFKYSLSRDDLDAAIFSGP
ncbi:MAG: DUF3143 domain-containing protein [Cyanobacteria bacterium J06627_8]